MAIILSSFRIIRNYLQRTAKIVSYFRLSYQPDESSWPSIDPLVCPKKIPLIPRPPGLEILMDKPIWPIVLYL